MTTIYVDHKGDAFRKAVRELLDLGRDAGYTWVRIEYEHPNAGLRASSSWGAARPPLSQSNGECYAIALHPDGTSTDLKKPYCRDCGSNDVSMEGDA